MPNIAGVYVTLTRVKTLDQPLENAPIVAEEMERWLRDIAGYEGFLMLTREGTAIGMTFWESREAAERHRTARTDFRERVISIAGVEIEESVEYDVAYASFRRPPAVDQPS